MDLLRFLRLFAAMPEQSMHRLLTKRAHPTMKTGIPEIERAKSVHFTGVGGIGMSALAQLLCAEGLTVTGSDRAWDQGRDAWLYDALRAQGIVLSSQVCAQLDPRPDCVVVTRAVESANTELAAARARGIPVVLRSDLLAGIVNHHRSVGVTGSCGKSTTTAMIGQILEYAGVDPTVILGAIAERYRSPSDLGNLRKGRNDFVVAEVDESDGSVRNFRPEVAVITMVSKDHCEPEQLRQCLRPLVAEAKGIILSEDCLGDLSLGEELANRVITCGNGGQVEATSVELGRAQSQFQVAGTRFMVPVPGTHNVSNALCAIGTARFFDIPDEVTKRALAEYGGLFRRWNLVGSPGSVDIVDDFAHSPTKISRALMTAHLAHQRVHAVYQPHGYQPTRFLWKEYLEAFVGGLKCLDCLYLLDIYDAGGTVDRSISSDDLAAAIREQFPRVTRPRDRQDLIDQLRQHVVPGDVVLVMGARDFSLTELAKSIAAALTESFGADVTPGATRAYAG
jgi:UDP-N-acetylmuramate--alanine ligase